MRLDRLLSECKIATRTEAAKACRAGLVTVNGTAARKSDQQVDPERDRIVFSGEPVEYRKFFYILLNKPDGYISATEDGRDPVVTELLPEKYRKMGLFPCGRLDKHTLGLMLLTNDGALSHRLLAPKSHVTKSYGFSVRFPLSAEDVSRLEEGVDIGDYVTKPCQVELRSETEGVIFITEGKYHQIKRMMEAVNNRITFLERLTFGPLSLDPTLDRGDWRLLTDEEEKALLDATRK